MRLRLDKISVFLHLMNNQNDTWKKMNIYHHPITTINNPSIYHRLLLVRTLPTTTTTTVQCRADRNENKACCCAAAGLTQVVVFWPGVTYTTATQIIKPSDTPNFWENQKTTKSGGWTVERWWHPCHLCAGCWSAQGQLKVRTNVWSLEPGAATYHQHQTHAAREVLPPHTQGLRG